MASKAQIRASDKYNKENTTGFLLRLNLKTDKDIIERLNNVGSKAAYIKELIRNDTKQK